MNSLQEVPQELVRERNWVVWSAPSKMPFNPNDTHAGAKANDSTTWGSFNEALDAVTLEGFTGIGFEFGGTDCVGIDFDNVLVDGKPEDYVAEILAQLHNPYCEVSPSGKGLHAFIRYEQIPGTKRKFSNGNHYGAEIYSGREKGRYFTITGQRFSGEGVPKLKNIDIPYLLLSQIHDERFKKLWLGDASDYDNDQSRADLALAWRLARLLDRNAALVERAFNASKPGQREKWTSRQDYRDWTLTKACASKKEPIDMGVEPTNVSAVSNEIEVHVVTDEQPDMPRSVLTGRLGEICEQNLLTDFPVAFAWPALVTAASVLVPPGEQMHNLYTALIGLVNRGKTQCIDWSVKSLRVSDDPSRYSEVKAGSAERLLRYMNRLRDAGRLAPYVLMALDEWKFFFDKAGIENSVFPTLLTTGFYKRDTSILDSHGHPIDVPAAFSWLGGVVTEVYDECFSRVTALGLYDRFLHGVQPSGYAGFNYRPFDGQVLPADFTPTKVTVDKSVWRRLKEWKQANPHATREAEIALRVAIICASFDGAPLLAAKDLEPHLILATEQMKLRETFKPNSGETPDAQCAIKVENYVRAHGATGEWLDVRAMMHAIHYERFGPLVFERTIRGLSSLKIVELGERTAGEGHRGRPAKVIRLVLE